MQIIYKKIGEVIPYENNPRKNDEAVEYVAKSIKEFGFKVPIIIDKNNVIVTGHTRLKAAMQLGMKEVPVIMADDLTEDQIKAFRLADNKVSEFAGWDFDALNMEFDGIELDMSDFGFTETSIDWDDVAELSDSNYDKPQHNMLECPACHHIDRDIHFKKVEGVDVEEEEQSDDE